jgi:NNP family nitrate/nitrite transporter-like MFS transporter
MTATAIQRRRPESQAAGLRPYVMLAVAARRFAVSFWAWALLAPLGAHFRLVLHLSSFEQALVVAVPVIAGSLGRIPVGAMTDRFGGHLMFPVWSFATIVPVLFLGLVGYRSLAGLLIGGFFLGLAGTALGIGVPFVSAWFPPDRRGLAIGIFGIGMGGAAISALTTVKLVGRWGIHAPFLIIAVVLAVYGILAALVLREAPQRPIPAGSTIARLAATLRLPVTWQAAAFYVVGFGGFVAFSVYLPIYLKNAYLISPADAADRMAGFVLVAALMRAVGGWLADRFPPGTVLAGAFAIVAADAACQSLAPSLAPWAMIAFLTLAAALGTSTGAVLALVAQRAPANEVGAVTGLVGAAGGLGGFVPPLLMGTIYGASGSYAWGLIALAVVAAAAAAYAAVGRQPSGNATLMTLITPAPRPPARPPWPHPACPEASPRGSAHAGRSARYVLALRTGRGAEASARTGRWDYIHTWRPGAPAEQVQNADCGHWHRQDRRHDRPRVRAGRARCRVRLAVTG